jgi:hypothetical protein
MHRCVGRSCGEIRLLVRREVRRRTHNGEPLIARHTNGTHIGPNRLAEVNARVEASRDELCASLWRCGDLEDDVREPTTTFEQLWGEHHRGRDRRHQHLVSLFSCAPAKS